MTKKPNFWKCMMGVVVLAILFVATFAITRAPLTSAKTMMSTSLASAPVSSTMPVPRIAPAPPAGTDSIFGVFELEGDILDSPGGPPDDWSTVNCGPSNALAKTGVLHDGTGLSIYTGGGSKDPELLSSWKHKDGSVPDKDEIINAYAAKYFGSPAGDTILIFGADRFDNSGTAFIGFWFFKNPVFAAADGKFREGPLATDTLSTHAIGDVLVLVEFTQGGAVPTAKVFEWVGANGSESGGTLNDITGTAPLGSVFSVSNSTAQTIAGSCTAWQYQPKGGAVGGPISVNSFFEGGINLDAFPALAGSCFSSFLVETRSSSVVTATLKDFTLGQFNTCVSLEVSKEADDTEVCEGTPTDYKYTVHNTAGVAINATLRDDNETSDPLDDIDVVGGCVTRGNGVYTPVVLQPDDGVAGSGLDQAEYHCSRTLSPGSHTNVVTAKGTFGSVTQTATATETVVVNPNPSCSISGPTPVCAGTTGLSYSSSATAGATHSWSISGNGSITSGTTGSSVTVTAGAAGSFTLTDQVTLNGCTSMCSYPVTVNARPTAVVSGGGEYCVTPGGSANISAALTGTGPWNVTWSDGVTQSNVAVSPASRTVSPTSTTVYTVTAVSDANCSGSASGSATVTVDPNPTVNVTVDTSCADQITLTATGHGGSGSGYKFKWDGVGSFTTTPTLVVSTGPSTHTVEVIDGNNCPISKTVHIGLCCKDCNASP
ncbi:MAG TPA: hypothetical protein VLB68_16265 [Pyrinomonadaceae bacterium]|nr:hypothetical protein [Pyrinomonadaceae bacterium]